MGMFLVGILTWWYSDGIVSRVWMIKRWLVSSVDFFSIDILLSTFFAPFRQISAGSVSGPIGDQARAFLDRLLSRIVGATMRSFVILFGLIAIFLQTIFCLVMLLFWLATPALPVVGLIMMALGWLPI